MKKFLVSLLAAIVLPALAEDFRTTNATAVLYDAPSLKGRKLFVMRSGTPVELISSMGNWSKVRDSEGGMTWIEKKYLSEKRAVLVVAPRAEIRQKADGNSPLVFEAEKNVSLELVKTEGVWAAVRHRDGQAGFVRRNQIWGL
ncbi:MAG: SH3 domain-containing protein [Candidatus Accumulibacter sp.]|jgi:SH3-like domain-containing protein|nr:SH3 domain-containing protein [Accumulibacter sp.]